MPEKTYHLKSLIVILMLFVLSINIFSGVIAYAVLNINIEEPIYYATAPEEEFSEYTASAEMETKMQGTFMYEYFNNLKRNMGNNVKGSCGYVAIGMLLSYYDTFLNDNIIPENYDAPSMDGQSPGIYMDIFGKEVLDSYGVDLIKNAPPDIYLKLLKDNIENSATPSLHAKLIDIGNSLGYYNQGFNPNYPCGTDSEKQLGIIKAYLKEIGYNFREDYELVRFSVSSYDTEIVEPYVKNYIYEGYPVILGLSGDSGGHVCVAYDYDDSGNIYANMGWGNEQTHSSIKVKFPDISSAIILKFKNMEHTHSNNYVIDGKEYCYCTDEVEIYHNHSYSLENTNSLTHTRKCACGLAKTESHNFNSYAVISGMDGNRWHNVRCACGEYKRQVHNFVTINSSSGPYRYCNKCFWSELKFEHLKLFSYMTS